MKLKFLFVLLIASILYNNVYSQGYKIKIKVTGVSDTIVFLGHHYGDKKFAKDTLLLDKTGSGTFTGKEKLDGGIYMVLFPSRDMTYFELIIDEDQDFALETDTTEFLQHMKITGSEVNKLFYEFQKEMISMQKKAEGIQKRMQSNKDNADSTKALSAAMTKINEDKDSYWNKLISEYPKSFMAVLLKAMQDVKIPEFELPADCKNPDSLKRVMTYLYAKEHYFDNIDFSDKRILMTPVFHNKLNTFMKKMVLQQPDSIIKEGDKIVKLSEADTNIYRYVLVYMLGYYENTKIMGMDKVFVFFGENYYLNGKAYWADSTLRAKIAERVIALKPNLLGEIAPELKLETVEGRPISLYDIKAEYTILYFYEPSCGHCKKITPKVSELYNKYKSYGIEVFAVYTQHDKKEWEEFINKLELKWINVYDHYNQSNFRMKYDIYSTPVIYLLDKDKKLIAKRLESEQLEGMLKKLLNIADEIDNKDLAPDSEGLE